MSLKKRTDTLIICIELMICLETKRIMKNIVYKFNLNNPMRTTVQNQELEAL
jgi:hypothetical protein